MLSPGPYSRNERVLSQHYPNVTPDARHISAGVAQLDDPGVAYIYSWASNYPEPLEPSNNLPESPETSLPTWMDQLLLPWGTEVRAWPDRGFHESRMLALRGWPAKCLWHEYDYSSSPRHPLFNWPKPAPVPTLAGATEFPINLTAARNWRRPLPFPVGFPLRPLWIGLAINTVTFALIWAVLLFGVPWAHRTLRGIGRSRRGLCPACAYDLRATPTGNPCPECGYISKHRRTPAPPI
jgi:hypothetical protein